MLEIGDILKIGKTKVHFKGITESDNHKAGNDREET